MIPSTRETWDGAPLKPGVNLDPIDISAGLREAELIGYDDAVARMVVTYALQRHQRGEEDGAERTWLSEYPRDFGSWRRILAAAVAEGTAALARKRAEENATKH